LVNFPRWQKFVKPLLEVFKNKADIKLQNDLDEIERDKQEYQEYLNDKKWIAIREENRRNRLKAKEEKKLAKFSKTENRKFRVIIMSNSEDMNKESFINISGLNKYEDLDTSWLKKLAIEKSAFIVLIDQYGNVYERLGPDGKYPVREDKDTSWETWFSEQRGYKI